MHGTPKAVYDEILRERFFCERQAAFADHVCSKRSTMEHVWKYGGKQIHRKWAIIRLCEKAHSVGPYSTNGGILDKRKNEFLSLRHATEKDLQEFPRTNWEQLRNYLNSRYT